MSRLSSKPTTLKKKSSCPVGQLSKFSANLPGIARPRLPGIGAACRACAAPRSGFFHRGRFSDFALASDFARKIIRKRCGGERIASGVGFHPENPIAGPAPEVCQRCCPRSIADGVFFSPLTRPAVNPAVGTGLLHPILLWAQDCSTQSCCGHRIAPPNPAVGTGLLRPILLRAQDCSTQSCCGRRIAPVPRKRWKRSAVQHSPRLAARIARKTPAVRRYTPMHSRTRRPASRLRIFRRSVTRRARARTSALPRRAARCSPRPGRRRGRGG